MTFNQLVWKMAKGNRGKYLFYYLCNSFAVLFFFMYSTIYLNQAIEKVKIMEGIRDILTIPGVGLLIFTVFFITYAHRIFTRRRKKEFALLMTLGMSKRDIARLLLLENALIAIASIITGIVTGMVFSRLIFLLFINITGLGEIPFNLSLEMFIYSIGAYLFIFLISVIITLYLTLSRTVSQNMKSDRVADAIKHRSPVFGLLGVLMIIGSAVLLYNTFSNPSMAHDAGGYLLMSTLGILMGLYVALSQGMSFFMKLARKHKFYYYNELLSLSSLEYKFKQLTSIMLLVTIMSMVTIFYSTTILIINSMGEQQVMDDNPNDLTYIETETKNNISTQELYSIVDKAENPVKEHETVKLFAHYESDPYWEEAYYEYVFIGLSDYNRIAGRQEILDSKEYIYLINDVPKYALPDSTYEHGLSFNVEGGKIEYTLKETIVDQIINRTTLVPTSIIVISDEEFGKINNALIGDKMQVHILNFQDWKASEQVTNELKDRLEQYNNTTPPYQSVRLRYSEEEEEYFLQPISKVVNYNYIKNSSRIMFFVTTFISILFFFGSFILLYLNIFSTMEEEKAKYKKLFKIGITKREIKKLVSKEMSVLFFFAPLLGCSLAFVYILSISQDVGGIMENPQFLVHFARISGVYLFIQMVYYFYSRKKMLSELEI
ncbi:ABC transporter permease [Sutcliffiella horikoshii]|uniref:ABC transporter permease n=1 Tax=Sutcliffiella horikoshii TaxID=79883 RepID=UPI001F441A33|nr:ABC transporter permease [Sutcliffiella horikoshii]MCG1022900.1 ABC transporter permease [Sutcliffiella horikoshii]